MVKPQPQVDELRKTILKEEDMIASKSRFGLFSQPPPLAVGDNSLFKQPKIHKGENGKPVTQPANLMTNPCRTGLGKSDFYTNMDSIYTKDPYVDQFKREAQYHLKMHSKSTMHETDFKPASGFKTIIHSPFKYMPHEDPEKKTVTRGPDGRVNIKPRNISTNPCSKVERDLLKHPKHLPDPYSGPVDIGRRVKTTKGDQEAVFKSMCAGNSGFYKNKLLFGHDEKTKAIMEKARRRPISAMNHSSFKHEEVFRPVGGISKGEAIGKFPEFIMPSTTSTPTPPEPTRKLKTEENKQQWRPSFGGSSRPTPSISYNKRNIGRYH